MWLLSWPKGWIESSAFVGVVLGLFQPQINADERGWSSIRSLHYLRDGGLPEMV
jgi:hypothetical protein